MDRSSEPANVGERQLLVGWLAFHREALAPNCEGSRRRSSCAPPCRSSLDDVSVGNGHSVRWNLVKVIDEYARRNGPADLIRESIDGVTGE